MSTIDPNAARREHARRMPTGRALLAPGVSATVGGLVSGYLLTWLGTPPDGDDPQVAALVLAAVGLMVALLLVVGGLTAWVSRASRNRALPGVALPLALGCAAAALGVSVSAAPERFQAPRSGTAVLALACCASGFALLAALTWVLRRRRLAREEAAIRAGRHVQGRVSEQGYTRFRESDRILTTVTYAFEDASGTTRYVRRTELVHAADPVVDGEVVDVWFDPAAPGDERRIAVRRIDAAVRPARGA